MPHEILVDALLSGLPGQECSLVRRSYAEQLVVGFGPTSLSAWPLRKTYKAAWTLYSSYGTWRVTDGAWDVAQESDELDPSTLQRVRALLLHQHVETVHRGREQRELTINFQSGASLTVRQSADAHSSDAAWSLESPTGLLLSADSNDLTVSRVDEPSTSESRLSPTEIHSFLREIATEHELALFEAPGLHHAGIDAVLTTRDDRVILVQVKTRLGEDTVVVTSFSSAPGGQTSHVVDLPADELSHDRLRDEIVRAVEAA